MARKPVIIAGAGISGLVLAQHLHAEGVPFEVYERDADTTTRGFGWGLTLHWSLPALRSLLPDELEVQLNGITVDDECFSAGKESRFPFFDLSTGELKASTPQLPGNRRMRVSRHKLRELMTTGIDIKWGKGVSKFESTADEVVVWFEDGSSTTGCLLVGCDSRNSRIRQSVTSVQPYRIPIRIMGAQFLCSAKEAESMRSLDPFFLQGAASQNDSFMYFSILDAPGNKGNTSGKYNCQVCISWPFRKNFFGSEDPTDMPATKEAKMALAKEFAGTWAEPFKTFIRDIMPADTEFIGLDLTDFPPPLDFRSSGRVTLMGDAIHAMAMYRGEGANHAIVDVLEFSQKVTSVLDPSTAAEVELRAALDAYEELVVKRTRPAVLASRKACLDAHVFENINPASPLVSKRQMYVDFEE